MKEIILEKTINKLIAEKVVDFSSLNDKTIILKISDLQLDFCFYVNQGKFFVFSENKPADAEIVINLFAFKDLLDEKDLTTLVREEKVTIIGELKTAQLLVDLLKDASVAETLNNLLPNSATTFGKQLKDDIVSGVLKDKIIDFLIQPRVHK